MNAAELARAIGTPDARCPKCDAAVWYRAVLSSHMYVCEGCGWLTFDLAEAKRAGWPNC